MYCKGEFEQALVFYHRGNKLRPELQEFRLGIQKAKEAIDNAVGSKYQNQKNYPLNETIDFIAVIIAVINYIACGIA